ncbi:MAG: hypothetical protein QGD94_05020 [Planctomycetia bacterium]|nr:hypothetical protein [Planctomycetia bacterium]
MGFTADGITNVRSQPLLLGRTTEGTDITDAGFAEVRWESTQTTLYHQVYVDGRLAVVTEAPGVASATVPVAADGPSLIEVIAVDSEDRWTDFSGSLTGFTDEVAARVKIQWSGGTYLDPAIDHFDVFSNGGSGDVDFQVPLNPLPVSAYAGGRTLSGFGRGGFGRGGFGRSAMRFAWTTDKLTPGTHKFAVLGVDAAGNRLANTLQEVELEVAPPPRPPTDFAVSSYDQTDKQATLSWTASPDV